MAGYGVFLYDMSIEDVKERFAKRIKFDKAYKAANFLGMQPCNFVNAVNGKQKYVYHRETEKKYAVRKVENNIK
jgi:hypothetical protein